MINVGHKSVTLRTAEASGSLLLRPMTLEHIRSGKLAKGDAINTAQVAGIMAAKRTADFVPLCHPLPLDSVDVDVHFLPGHLRQSVLPFLIPSAQRLVLNGVQVDVFLHLGLKLLSEKFFF